MNTRNAKLGPFLILYLFLTVCHAAQGELDDGIEAVEKKEYAKAYQIFKALAEQGNAEAQYNLAILYRQGKGVKQDKKTALKWFEQSANQGLASAEYYLGHLYDNGDTVNRDSAIAVSWYKKAAEKGNPLAQSNLGVAYASGEGVKQDIIKAYVWFSLAASQGLTAALENRSLLKKEMSEELQKNAQRLTNEYFNRYVAPFIQSSRKMPPGGYPGATEAHKQMQNEPGGQSVPHSSENHPAGDNHKGAH